MSKKKVGNVKKLESIWEGPYEIAKMLGGGAYMLKEIHCGKKIPITWNLTQHVCVK